MKISYIFNSIKNVVLTFITLLSMMLPTSHKAIMEYRAENADKLIMSFSVVSDTHVETTDSNAYNQFKMILNGIKAGKDTDATVYLGDNVMNGQALENILFYSAVKAIMPSENNFVVLGNHDIGNGEGDYDKLCENFLKNNSHYLKNNLEKPYYYKIINGCYMIFLASEDIYVNDCYLSDEQYFWLKNTLDEAAEADAPIFVFNHHPIDMLRGVVWYSLINLLSDYDNLLYFHGHTHKKLDRYSFRNVYGINTICLPRSTGASHYKSGNGIVVEVYEDQILVRGRNFIDGEWIDDIEFRYPLV